MGANKYEMGKIFLPAGEGSDQYLRWETAGVCLRSGTRYSDGQDLHPHHPGVQRQVEFLWKGTGIFRAMALYPPHRG